MNGAETVSIVGGGLGGLTAALALHKRGFDVTVYEQAAELSEVGAGVQLSPNAMKVVEALGLGAPFRAIAFEPDRHVVRSWKSGHIVSATAMKGVYREAFGSGYFGAHRADFHQVLRDALPKGMVRLGTKCVGATSRNGSAMLQLADGSEIASDIVVGADGIHSTIRASLFGPEAPRFTGNICWRGLVPTAAVPQGMFPHDMTVWFGPHSNVVCYYVRGGKLINWVASHEAADWTTESWRSEASIDEVIETYRDWHPNLRYLFANTERCFKWALYDRAPMERWSVGRTTLLGDAAHAMLPFLAQGACMAIEDAYVLATTLDQHRKEPERALKIYEAERLPWTSRVQLAASSRAKVNHLTSPWARLRRDLIYRLRRFLLPAQHTYQIEWIYGHDVTARSAADAPRAREKNTQTAST